MKIQFNEIIDPKTNKKYPITSRKGKQILNNYIKTVEQHGGFIFREPFMFYDVDTENPQDDEICLVNDIVDPRMEANGWITADSLREYLKKKALYNQEGLDDWYTMVGELNHWANGPISDEIWPAHIRRLKNTDNPVRFGEGPEYQGTFNRFHNFMRVEVKPDGSISAIPGTERGTPQAQNPEAERIINNNIRLIINNAKEKARRYFNQHGHDHPEREHTAAPPAAAQEHGPALVRQNTQELDRDEQFARAAQMHENILAEQAAALRDLRARERFERVRPDPVRPAADGSDGGASHYQRPLRRRRSLRRPPHPDPRHLELSSDNDDYDDY